MISDNNNNNLKFKRQNLKFFPEDVEKMEKMSLEEKNEYIRKLKKENKYVIVDE